MLLNNHTAFKYAENHFLRLEKNTLVIQKNHYATSEI
jgi:hypothetical protein